MGNSDPPHGTGIASSTRRRRGGVALLVALCLMVLCEVLAVTLVTVSQMDMLKSENHDRGLNARLAAESGVEMMLLYMRSIRLPIGESIETSVASLRDALQTRLSELPSFAGQTVELTSSDLGVTLYVPQVTMDNGQWFEVWIAPASETHLRMKVAGWVGDICRAVTVDLDLEAKLPQVFEYGLASRGQVLIGGSTRILYVNEPSEANVFSATTTYADAVQISGSAVEVAGDLYLADSFEHVSITGSPTIGGTNVLSEIEEHIHSDIDPPDFPELDTAPLIALATNTLDPTVKTSESGQTYSNIRIPAGTNPNFGADTTLNGVIYVEAPNTVKFNGHATVNAIIVTEESDEPIQTCEIEFAGTADANGVAGLPTDDPQFDAVREMTGTFILAPGFHVTFGGNFSTINGSVAADQLTFSGTAEGVIRGTVVGLDDLPMSLQGNVDIWVNKKDQDQDPAGFVKSLAPVVEPDSYREMKRRTDWK